MKNTIPSLRCLGFLFFLALSLLLSAPGRAFEAWEHETVSSMSIIVASNHVALSHAGLGGDAARWERFQTASGEFIHGLPHDGTQTKVNYGRIVMLVDFMRDPYTMTHNSGTGSGWPTNADTCNLPYLVALSKDTLSMYGASHVDYDHFQGRALFAFWFWHKQAVAAAQEGNLWGGLLLEAYANHFLEDFFAPGHILAPRDDNSHDMYTLMMHDYYNDRGLTYTIATPAQLVDLVRKTQPLVAGAPLTIPAPEGEPASKHISLTAEVLSTFLDSLARPSVDIKCYGDNRLKRNPQQLPLVVSYCARAIADVMESYLAGKIVNSFATYKWNAKFFPMRNQPRVEALDFTVAYGGLTSTDNPRTLSTNKFLYKPVAASTISPENLTFPIAEEVGPDALKNRAIGVSLGVQSIALGGGSDSGAHIRGLWELGTVVWGRRFDQVKQDWQVPRALPSQLALVLGYSGVADTREMGNGVFGRVMWPWPQVNAQVNLIVGGRFYSGSGVMDGWGDYESLRLEWGMHLANLFFGVGHDRYATSKSLEHGLMVETGLTVAFPISRWKDTLSLGGKE